MLDAIRQSIDRWSLAQDVHQAVLAVSGGSDSMALLWALHRLWTPRGVQITVWHLDHGLRGAAGEEDGRCVAAFCRTLGLPCTLRQTDVRRRADATGQSLEMAARSVRYEWLVADARHAGANALCTGHTADDQIETVLMRWGRGSGPRGLGGIHPRSDCPGHPPLVLLRPLLDCRRSALRDWLAREGIAWRDDPSNRDPRILRNRVRTRLVPAFEAVLGHASAAAALRTAEILRDEERQWLGPLVAGALETARAPDGHSLDCQTLRTLVTPLARRVLLRWLQDEGLDPAHQSLATLERTLAFSRCASRGTRTLSLGGGYRLRRSYERLRCLRPDVTGDPLERAGPRRARPDDSDHPMPTEDMQVRGAPPAHAIPLSLPMRSDHTECCEVPALGLRVRWLRSQGLCRDARHSPLVPPHECTLSWAAVEGRRLALRGVLPGDRMRPLGAGGCRKLSDLLIDLKIPRDERPFVPVLLCDEEIVWLPGIAVAARYAVECPTAPVLRLRLSALTPRATSVQLPPNGVP